MTIKQLSEKLQDLRDKVVVLETLKQEERRLSDKSIVLWGIGATLASGVLGSLVTTWLSR